MEEVAGVTAQARITTSSLYLVIQKELLANSIPGRPTKQAPRLFMSTLAVLEELSGRQILAILPCVRIVDSAPVMVHDAFH